MVISQSQIEAAMEEESDFVPNECGERVDVGVDRISELPDEIIIHILSFLTLKKAAATSVLSSRWLDVWKYTPNLELDRISQLPDQIIAVILSFLPIREAAATSVLSSRWSQLWKHTPILHFNMHIVPNYESEGYDYVVDEPYDDDDDLIWKAERDNFIEIVNSVIQSHKALSLKKFRIYLPYFKIAKCVVTKWLEFVFSRQVESLELIFHEYCGYVLEELLRESRICLQPHTDLIFLQSLKRLVLSHLTMSGEDIELFLRNCPLLEQLVIIGGTLTSDVELCGANLMLKRLEIIHINGQKSMKVSAPNLTYIYFTASNEREPKLLLQNVPKLVEAEFLMRSPDMVLQCFASSTSCHFSQLQILNLEFSTSKLLFQLQDTLANGFQMPNLKELGILCDKMHNHSLLPVITALIWEFPRLEEFKFTCSDLLEEQPAACTQITTNGGRLPHQHLKVFELKMSPRQNANDDIVELMIYISNNCVALRRIIIGGRYALDDPATMDFMKQLFAGKLPYTFKWNCLYTAC